MASKQKLCQIIYATETETDLCICREHTILTTMVLSSPSASLVCTAAMHLTDLFIFDLSFFDPSIISLIFLPCPLPISLYAILLNLYNLTNLSLLASLSPRILYLCSCSIFPISLQFFTCLQCC